MIRLKTMINLAGKLLFPFGVPKTVRKPWLKASLASSICLIFCLIKPMTKHLGSVVYLVPITAVSVDAGRRFGSMFEALVMCCGGIGLGLAYATFGRYFAVLIENHSTETKALAFLCVCEFIMLVFVGTVKAAVPRLFLFSFMIFLVVHFSFLTNLAQPIDVYAKEYAAPLLLGLAVVFFVNIAVFPDFGSTFLGSSVLDSISELHAHLGTVVHYFTNSGTAEGLVQLQKQRKAVRDKTASSRTVLTEATFEVSYSYVAPQALSPILKKMTSVLSPASALVGACELEYSLIGKDMTQDPDQTLKHSTLDREIAHADERILRTLLQSVDVPIESLFEAMSLGFDCVKLIICHCFDVSTDQIKMANGGAPGSDTKLSIDYIDERLRIVSEAIVKFDSTIPNQLEHAAYPDGNELELLPRDEYFLLSSFLLNFRECANQVTSILVDARAIYELRIDRESHGWRGKNVWFSSLTSRKLLTKYFGTGNEEVKETDVVSMTSSKRLIDPDLVSSEMDPGSTIVLLRLFRTASNKLADFIDWCVKYDHIVKYVIKYVTLVMLVSFPAFSASLRQWYIDIRGNWVGFVAHLVLESSIGGTVEVVIVRTVGVFAGSSWSYASYEAGWNSAGGYVVTCVVLIPGLCLGMYYLKASPYPKAAMIAIVSLNLVLLTTLYPTIPGTIFDNFIKRCVTMLVGGAAATLVQITLFPVKARVELVSQLVQTLRMCESMAGGIAHGIEGEETSYTSRHEAYVKLSKDWKRSNKCLRLADDYRRLASQEPRLKGSFKTLNPIYAEIIFVLHQIVDKFQNIAFLREQYGSAVMDELLPFVYIYRRDIYGCLSSTFRAVGIALQEKVPMPQFMPSPRIAHLRLVNRVREVLATEGGSAATSRQPSRANSIYEDEGLEISALSSRGKVASGLQKRSMVKKTFMSWSATASGLEEIIEYIEELDALTKALMGSHDFQQGFLSRPLDVADPNEVDKEDPGVEDEAESDPVGTLTAIDPRRMRRYSLTGTNGIPSKSPIGYSIDRTLSQIAENPVYHSLGETSGLDEQLPASLRRVSSRRHTLTKRRGTIDFET